MKTVVLLLIFSSIAGIAGYYYGRNSVPEEPPKPTEAAVVTADVKEEPTQPASTEPVEKTSSGEQDVVGPVESGFLERSARSTQTLTDTQGRSIEAKVLSIDGDQVKVRRSDGLETSFPIAMLIPEDIAFCEYLRRELSTKQKAESSDHITWDDIFDK
jgi:hypothetical protein